jgi:ABC-type lipoprotein export system ATPase subunit
MVLQVSQLKKSFRTPEGATSLIVDVPAFSLRAGEQVALVGRSGSGKTTLLHLIAGILRPDSGSIQIDGNDLTAMSESQRDLLRARDVGYVFQTFNLLQGYTAMENVLLGMTFSGTADRGQARQLLERVGLQDRLNYKPAQLSVGQQQRVAVARALANAPKLVLADEPTGNLDPDLAQESITLIQEACRENNAALLLVSHDQAITGRFETIQDLSHLNVAGGVTT